MTHDPRAPQERARRRLAELGTLFDAVSPTDRVGAEAELRDAGQDPRAVGGRFVALARSAHAPTPAPARPPRPAPPRRAVRGTLLWGTLAAMALAALAWSLAGDRLRSQIAQPAAPTPAGRDTAPRRLALPPGAPAAPYAAHADPTASALVDATPAATPLASGAPVPGRPAAIGQAAGAAPWSAEYPAALLPGAGKAAAGTSTAGRRWILDSATWKAAEGMLPPAVLQRVRSGDYWYTVVPVAPAALRGHYSPAFWTASTANAERYDVDAATCGLKDVTTGAMPEHYFGYPFPHIDPSDPLAGCKLAWNAEAASAMGEGQGGTFTLLGLDRSGERARLRVSAHALPFLGRHGGPIDNPERLRAAALTALLEPLDVDGVAGLTKRPNDWHAPDRAWMYTPATRRVRRVEAATRSQPIAGLELVADDLNCFGGKIESATWRLVGEQTMLAPLLDPQALAQERRGSPTRAEVQVPYPTAAYETPGSAGAPWLVVDHLVLVPRPVWVLEVTSTDPHYRFGRLLLYMDKDLHRIYWKLAHDRSGAYVSNAMCVYHFSRSADGHFSAVSPSLVLGVDERADRAALAGRPTASHVERGAPGDFYSLRTLTRQRE